MAMKLIGCLVAVALLGCLADAQSSGWEKPQPHMPPPYTPPQHPTPQKPNPQHPYPPQNPYTPPHQPPMPPKPHPQHPYPPQNPYTPPHQPPMPPKPHPQHPMPQKPNPQHPYTPPQHPPQHPMPPNPNPQHPYTPPQHHPMPQKPNPQHPYTPPQHHPMPQKPNPQHPYIPPQPHPMPQKPNPQLPHPQKPQPPPKKTQYPQKQHDSQNPQNPQHPKNPQNPQNPQHPSHPQVPVIPMVPDTYKSCDVPSGDRVKCGAPTISSAECESINCCHDGQSCFYGKAVTLQCTKDGQFIVVVARDATLPKIDLESISFLDSDASCGPIGYTSAFAVYQFTVGQCGTSMTEEAGVIVYTNRMSCSYEVLMGPLGAITRDTQFDLNIQCRYRGTTVEALVVDIKGGSNPLPAFGTGPLHVELRIANGMCNTKGCDPDAVAYTSFYAESEYPVTKVLREPVYVGIHILDRSDPNIVLTLGRCWATADVHPQSYPQWDLLVDGCPYRDDRYQTNLLPIESSLGLEFPRHHRHFLFKMFTFVSVGAYTNTKDPADMMTPMHEKIYIHCHTSVCTPTSGDNCEPRCFRKKREISSSVKLHRPEEQVVSSHGVIIQSGSAQ